MALYNGERQSSAQFWAAKWHPFKTFLSTIPLSLTELTVVVVVILVHWYNGLFSPEFSLPLFPLSVKKLYSFFREHGKCSTSRAIRVVLELVHFRWNGLRQCGPASLPFPISTIVSGQNYFLIHAVMAARKERSLSSISFVFIWKNFKSTKDFTLYYFEGRTLSFKRVIAADSRALLFQSF